MIAGQLALIAAALFTGAALYINIVEQPARLGLEDRALLAEWKPAYGKGALMQGPLALAGFALAVLAWYRTGIHWWLVGGTVLLANWPYTLIGIMPTNKILLATDPDQTGPETRKLIRKWGRLHAVRTALGCAATALFLAASLR